MPVHDWTRVSDGNFHDFHYSWVLEIKRALKRGLLPKGYYVMAEQFGGDLGAPDVLTLQTAGTKPEPGGSLSGTVTRTEVPPVVHARTTIAREGKGVRNLCRYTIGRGSAMEPSTIFITPGYWRSSGP